MERIQISIDKQYEQKKHIKKNNTFILSKNDKNFAELKKEGKNSTLKPREISLISHFL